MRKTVHAAIAAAFLVSTVLNPALAAQQAGALAGVARGADKAPLPNFQVHVRNSANGQLAGSTTSNQAGQFSFSGLQPGNYVIEIVDAAGKVIGLSEPIAVAAGATVTVTVSATAAGAMTASSGAGFSLLGLGPLASVAVVGAASAAAVTAVVATRDGKIVVCHRQAGALPQTTDVEQAARDSHLAHGDTLGACPASPSR